MIKVYSGIEGLPAPEYKSGEDYNSYNKRCDDYENKLVALAKKGSSSKIAGEVIKFGVADGYARYVVIKPTEVIHINTYDGYQFPYIQNLRGKDVTAEVKSQKEFRKIFSKKS